MNVYPWAVCTVVTTLRWLITSKESFPSAVLCGHRDHCSGCGRTVIAYNSRRDRDCPRCQGNSRVLGLEARGKGTAFESLAPHIAIEDLLVHAPVFTPLCADSTGTK